jgi:alkanesulfonate monooxygenase SsuD/methylene tetrahydromethanopterin reductase-like flavin-dependent oxidoreductase (luciferase family)
MSLRLTGNRLGQVLIPSTVGLLAAGVGAAGVLAATAAITSRVGLGAYLSVSSVSDPKALVRSLATVDVLSEGRLTVVLAGEDGRVDDVLDALDAQRSADPPVHPTVLLDGTTPATLDLIARRADGWGPGGLPVDSVGPLWAKVQELAAGHGRDPDDLELVVRAGIVLGPRVIDGTRPSWHGDADQVADDVDSARRIGASEVVLRLTGDLGLDEALDGYARIAEAAELRAVQMR